jgi:sodium-dependent dicarboxylate transporter 2/3/5
MSPGRRWTVVAIGGVVAVVAALLAPAPWGEDDATVQLQWQGGLAASSTLRLGATRPVVLEGAAGDIRVRASFPEGIPVRGIARATVIASRQGSTIRPALEDVRLSVQLADGRQELIPITRWDPAERALHAARRPPVRARVVLGVLGLVVVLWVTEALPLWVASLLVPVVLVAAGAGTAKQALAPFFHPIIALFFGGFLMAEAMQRAGLSHRIAVSIVAWAGRSPAMLFAAMLGVSALLSMWMSNTASTAVLVPIALAVTEPIGSRGYRKAAVLGIAFAATIGGVGSAIGTPANPLAIEFLGTFAGKEITFAGWFAYGLPLVVLFLPIMGVYLWWRSGARVDPAGFQASRRVAAEELSRLGPPTRQEWLVIGVFTAVIAVWLTQTWHKLDTGITALGGAVAMAALGAVRTEDLQRISWSALLTFGGGLALGTFLTETGTSDWLATRLEALATLPTWLGVTAVATLTLALTAVASNTATAAMLVPLAIPMAAVLGVDPVLLVIVVAIASSVDFALVIGTPPTMIAYSTRLFTTREIFRLGIVLDLVGIVLLVTAVVGCWKLLGLV